MTTQGGPSLPARYRQLHEAEVRRSGPRLIGQGWQRLSRLLLEQHHGPGRQQARAFRTEILIAWQRFTEGLLRMTEVSDPHDGQQEPLLKRDNSREMSPEWTQLTTAESERWVQQRKRAKPERRIIAVGRPPTVDDDDDDDDDAAEASSFRVVAKAKVVGQDSEVLEDSEVPSRYAKHKPREDEDNQMEFEDSLGEDGSEASHRDGSRPSEKLVATPPIDSSRGRSPQRRSGEGLDSLRTSSMDDAQAAHRSRREHGGKHGRSRRESEESAEGTTRERERRHRKEEAVTHDRVDRDRHDEKARRKHHRDEDKKEQSKEIQRDTDHVRSSSPSASASKTRERKDEKTSSKVDERHHGERRKHHEDKKEHKETREKDKMRSSSPSASASKTRERRDDEKTSSKVDEKHHGERRKHRDDEKDKKIHKGEEKVRSSSPSASASKTRERKDEKTSSKGDERSSRHEKREKSSEGGKKDAEKEKTRSTSGTSPTTSKTSGEQKDAKASSGDRDEGTSQPSPREKSSKWKYKDDEGGKKDAEKEKTRSTSPTTSKTSGEQKDAKASSRDRDEGTSQPSPREKSSKWKYKEDEGGKKDAEKEKTRSTSPTTSKTSGEQEDAKASSRDRDEGTSQPSPRDKSSKWKYSKEEGSKKDAEKEKTRSTSPSASKTSEQKGEETSRVRADSSQQSPRDKSPKWKYKKEEEAGKKDPEKEKARSTSPSASKTSEQKGEETSRERADSSQQSPRDKSSKWKYKKEEEAGKKDSEKEKARSSSPASKTSEQKGEKTSRERADTPGSQQSPRDKSSKWKFSKGDDAGKKVSEKEKTRSASDERDVPKASSQGSPQVDRDTQSRTDDRSRSSSQRRSTLLDASVSDAVVEAASDTSSKPSRRPSFDLAQYFQAKRDSGDSISKDVTALGVTAASRAAPHALRETTSVPHFGMESSPEASPDVSKVVKEEVSEKDKAVAQSALQQLEVELTTLRLTDLKKLAEAYKCPLTEVDRAYDEEDPKVALKALIMVKADLRAKRFASLKPSELRRRAETQGVGPRRIAEAEDAPNTKVAFLMLLLRPDQRPPKAKEVPPQASTELTTPVTEYGGSSPKFSHMTMSPMAPKADLPDADIAATRIQASVRGSATRKRLTQEAEAAVTIQRNVRDRQSKKRRSIDIEKDEAKAAAVRRSAKLRREEEKVLQCWKVDMETMKAKDLRRLAEDWACEPAELQAAEEDEQPKVAVRRLILERARRVTGELQDLSVPELKKKAKAAGCSDREVEQAEDGQEPKVDLFRLICSDLLKLHTATAQTTSAALEVPELAHAFMDLKVELAGMKVTELKQRAFIYGCTDDTIDAALDEENPKVALAQLILEVARDARDALLEMRLTELKQHAQEMGIPEDVITAAEDADQPKAALILAIFASKHEDPMESTFEGAFALEHVLSSEDHPVYAPRGRAAHSLPQDLGNPGPHHMGPGAFGLAWWYLKAEEDAESEDRRSITQQGYQGAAITALPLAQRPVPGSDRKPPEITLEDAGQLPQHLWPWVACHAPLKQGQRRKLAAKAVSKATEVVDATQEVQLSQALQMVHWCWANPHPSTAASSLVPMLFLGNESSAILHWALMLLATQLWRKATCTERKEYLVDNSQLKAKTTGLSYFFSRRFDDADPGKTALWGQVVVGRKSRGKWIKVGHCCYLPTELDGIQVLREDFVPEDLAVRLPIQSPENSLGDARPDSFSFGPGPRAAVTGTLQGGEVFEATSLAKDLKKALKKSVEQRQELDDAIDQCEQALAEKRHLMNIALEDTQLEFAAAQERANLEAGLLTSSASFLGDRNASQDYAKTSAARDAARHRARWLKEELQSVEAQSRSAATPRADHGPLRALQREVQRFRKELDRLESKEQMRRLDPKHQSEIEEARRDVQETAEDLSKRSLRLKDSEAALERRRAEVRAAAEEASLQKLEASSQKAECQRISGELLELQGEERTTSLRAQQLEREATSVAQAYERYKEVCFVYGAAMQRSSGPTSQLGKLQAKDDPHRPVRRGVDALIEALASRFGWPEVAFLRMDRRGSGRLGAQELRMGLLIGAGLDFPAITGLTAEALLSAIDRRSAGFITASDLAACRPDIWRDFGAEAITVDEKVPALPWLALGGPRKAFQDVASQKSLKWQGFETVLCDRLRALPKQEVQELFSRLAEKDRDSDSLVVSSATWDKITQEPMFRTS